MSNEKNIEEKDGCMSWSSLVIYPFRVSISDIFTFNISLRERKVGELVDIIFLILTFRHFHIQYACQFFWYLPFDFSHSICMSIFLTLLFRHFHIEYACQFFWYLSFDIFTFNIPVNFFDNYLSIFSFLAESWIKIQ
jgi:hypothetical protein